ncbi:MAG: DUF481 domain-containing protein [Myxococcales bacterium]
MGAQVNAEVLRPEGASDGLSGGLDADFSLSRGNVEALNLGGGARLRYQTLHPSSDRENTGARQPPPLVAQSAFITTSGRVAEQNDRAYVNQGFAHLRWTAMWLPRFGTEVFTQYQFNEFQRLRARALAGPGLRAVIAHSAAVQLWSGSGYMLEYNHIDVAGGAPDDPETLEHRWTNYLALRLDPFDGELLVQNTLYVQPRFDRFSDFRLLDELELMSQVNSVLSLGTKVVLQHDSAPPTGVKETDLQLTSTLRLTF